MTAETECRTVGTRKRDRTYTCANTTAATKKDYQVISDSNEKLAVKRKEKRKEGRKEEKSQRVHTKIETIKRSLKGHFFEGNLRRIVIALFQVN